MGLYVNVIEVHRVLGSVIDSDERCNDFLKESSVNCSNMLEKLAKHNKVSPQNVYKSFTNGLKHKLTFIARTTQKADSLLREAAKIIDKNPIHSMLNHPSYNDRHRKVFSLPLKEGGIRILLPEDRANEYERSFRICDPLQNHNAIDAEFHQEKILQKLIKNPMHSMLNHPSNNDRHRKVFSLPLKKGGLQKIDKNPIHSMLNHPSYNDRHRKVFSLPRKEGGLRILLPEDRANQYERSFRICDPLQNHNAIDAEFHQEKILQKIREEKQEQA